MKTIFFLIELKHVSCGFAERILIKSDNITNF